MNKTELLNSIRNIKREYNIRVDQRANDSDRKRITVLLTNVLLELPVKDLEGLTGIWIDSIATSGKPLNDLEKSSLIARILEPVLFCRLGSEKLKCDLLEKESANNPVKIWETKIKSQVNMEIIEEILEILKEDISERKQVGKLNAGNKDNGNIWNKQKVIGIST